jgi:hypothetical protein
MKNKRVAVVDGKHKYNLSNTSPLLAGPRTDYVSMNSNPNPANANRVLTNNAPSNIAWFVLK